MGIKVRALIWQQLVNDIKVCGLSSE